MFYTSTRDDKVKLTSSLAINNGISVEGGLFVPESFPQLSTQELESMLSMKYYERAAHILSKYLTDYTLTELQEYTAAAYAKFDGDPAPVISIDEGMFFLELWHGPTFAFKDMALTLLPYLLSAAKIKNNIQEKTLILVATSGDTGKAALEGFKDIAGTDIMVFYPSDGVSTMQKMQMNTQEGSNVFVGAIDGNFDDAQSAVKKIFADEQLQKELKDKGYTLSSANSINWGRLVPQIVYYISSYLDLVSGGVVTMGQKINYCVPTGNFGNILAGYYAKQMGLPIDKLICASNKNRILTDFLRGGDYDIAEREFFKTSSPSMDILISSNLERLLFEVTGRDAKKVSEMMKSLSQNKKYTLDKETLSRISETFVGGSANEEQTVEMIATVFDSRQYVMDPHTAVANYVYNEYFVVSEDETPTIVVSTASPYKFATDVCKAISGGSTEDPFKAIKSINSLSGEPIPSELDELRTKTVRFTEVFKKEDIGNIVLKYVQVDKAK